MRRRQLPGEPEPPTKGELKRQAQSVQDLANRLVDAPQAMLDALDLPEKLLDAIQLARRIEGGGALARQKQYVAKLMRKIDVEPIRVTLDSRDAERLQEARLFRQVERWRDRIVAEGEPAVEALVTECPGLDNDEFRALAAEARREHRHGGSQRASREVFRAVNRAFQSR